MDGVLLGFEIAAGVALFLFVFFVLIPRISLPFRSWYYRVIAKGTPPPEIRRYLMKSGIRNLQKVKLSPEEANKVGVEVLATALGDEDGVFQGMHDEMVSSAMAVLGSIPLDHCATCKRPIFIHESTKIDDRYFCENCGQAEKAKS